MTQKLRKRMKKIRKNNTLFINPNTKTSSIEPDINKYIDFNAKKILVAEDNPNNQKLIEILLSTLGASSTIVNDGAQAVEAYKNSVFDLVLMDINMPVMNGYDATIIIREDLKLAIPIIALTANALEGDREKFLNIGMNDYLAKPLEITNIDRILKKYRSYQSTN